MIRALSFMLFLLASMLVASTDPSHAQATRTWVSGVGDDANPCSRTAPCKTFAGAIAKTAAGGEISVLDPGGFGAVTITKSISLVAEGVEGSILASATNGIIINAGATDTVNIQGILIEGAGTGINGIRVLKARSVTIRNSVIRGFTGRAISIEPTTSGVKVHVANSLLTKSNNGVTVLTTGGIGGNAHLDDVHVVQNVGTGVFADGGFAFIRLNRSTITYNGTGIGVANGGRVLSFGNNANIANTVNGAPNNVEALQ